MEKQTKQKKTMIKVSYELKDYLLHCKIDNNHKNLEQTIWAFIGYDGERDGDINSATPSHTQETPAQTRADQQQVTRANSS